MSLSLDIWARVAEILQGRSLAPVCPVAAHPLTSTDDPIQLQVLGSICSGIRAVVLSRLLRTIVIPFSNDARKTVMTSLLSAGLKHRKLHCVLNVAIKSFCASEQLVTADFEETIRAMSGLKSFQ
jgi:hypothetical protein